MAKDYSIDVLINSIIDKKVFENIQGPKIILYDLNSKTKEMMEWFFRHDIYIEGFLLEDSRRDYSDIRYFNKRMIYFDELAGDEIILDTFGDNVESLKKRTKCEVFALYKSPVKPIIIYGAGAASDEIFKRLSEYNISILKYCDKDKKKQGTNINDIEIISPETLKNEYYGKVDVIVSLYTNGKEVAEYLEKNKIVDECYSYYGINVPLDNLSLQLSYSVYKLHALYDIIQYIRVKKCKIIFYGHSKDIIPIIKKFFLLDVKDVFGLACEDFVIDREGVKFIDKTVFLKLNLDQYIVVVLRDCRQSAEKLVSEHKLQKSRFVFQHQSYLFRLNYKTLYDPNLGYNIDYGIKHLSTGGEQTKKIGILGNSTSAIDQRFPKVWVEYFFDELNRRKINADIYCGAVGAHTTGQSLIKFIRDMSYMDLDILIYYGGASEGIDPKKFFVHDNQWKMLETLDQIKKKGINICKTPTDYVKYYFHQIRMMYAICKEFGIKFYPILRPIPTLKQPLSNRDKELLEHFHFLSSPENAGMDSFHLTINTKLIRDSEYMKKYPYITDFTHIFDGMTESIYIDQVHLTEFANKILAEKILKLVEDDLKF